MLLHPKQSCAGCADRRAEDQRSQSDTKPRFHGCVCLSLMCRPVRRWRFGRSYMQKEKNYKFGMSITPCRSFPYQSHPWRQRANGVRGTCLFMHIATAGAAFSVPLGGSVRASAESMMNRHPRAPSPCPSRAAGATTWLPAWFGAGGTRLNQTSVCRWAGDRHPGSADSCRRTGDTCMTRLWIPYKLPPTDREPMDT
jgi:ribosomal protein L40E